ncbi:hypothetical protein HVX06_22250 (plasmid) [Enterobacter sp. RHB15-C17]|jgi:hypothetical protein|nr:hypothetical protein HVX06_22250 [Enterobacter sp. RHB15-C17]
MEFPELLNLPPIPEGAISFTVVNKCKYSLMLDQYWSNREIYQTPQNTVSAGAETTVTFNGSLWMVASLSVSSPEISPFPVATIGVCSGYKEFNRIDYYRCESTTMNLPSDFHEWTTWIGEDRVVPANFYITSDILECVRANVNIYKDNGGVRCILTYEDVK